MAMSRKLQELMEELRVSDAETYYHSVRVKELVLKMLTLMNEEKAADYSAEEVEYICDGTLLHDIGKLRIRNEILTKNSALTPEEREDMGRHTTLGYELVRDEVTGAEREIFRNICLYHHERIDGNGQEKKKDLPLYLQIVSVCDVFDALYSDRIYRRGLPYPETIDLIKKGGSGKFHPDLIAYLERVTDELNQ